MPYYTPIPGATIDLTVQTPVLDLGSNLLLNNLSGSTEFSQYDIDANSATTLVRGDDVALVDDNGNPLLAGGTYAGSGTLSTASVNVGLPPLLGVTVQLNPINGHYIVGPDNVVYMVTDEPLTEDHLGLKISGTVAGIPINLLDINISELAGNALLAPILPALQSALDTLVVNVGYNPNGTLPLDDSEVVPCFCAGTMILTPNGEVPVERLRAGDLVCTKDNGPQPIRWMGGRKISERVLREAPNLLPIRIRENALGYGVPSADLLVSPQHRVLLKSRIAHRMFGADEVLVAAKQLLDVPGIDIVTDATTVEYYHLMFDGHQVVFSNGAETESMYAGPQALKSVGQHALNEITQIFPDILSDDQLPVPARVFVVGKQARKLAARHVQNSKPLLMN